MIRHCIFPILAGFLAAALAGCTVEPPQVAPAQAQVVPVSQPVERQVTDYVDFTGQTNAVEAVDIVPRVTGYLTKIAFQDGQDVNAGDLLFQIDPRPYKAQLDQADGQVTLNKAAHVFAKATYERDQAIGKTPGAVSQQQLDQDRASVDEAEARIKSSVASTEVYKLNLEFTNVTSPISGQVSRHRLSIGNLVNQDQTLLTTVVSLDPMYVYFYMDDPTLLRIRRAINEGKIKRYQKGKIPVLMGLAGEDGYPHEGIIDFVDNQVNPGTASIPVRGVFANPKPKDGVRLMAPGMFVRVRLPIGQPHPALLVIDRAIGADQDRKFVYVVDDKNMVQSARVTVGALQPDGLRVVSEGLQKGQWVVVGGLQEVRPRTTVEMEKIPMPSFNQPAAVKSKAEQKAANPAKGPAKK